MLARGRAACDKGALLLGGKVSLFEMSKELAKEKSTVLHDVHDSVGGSLVDPLASSELHGDHGDMSLTGVTASGKASGRAKLSSDELDASASASVGAKMLDVSGKAAVGNKDAKAQAQMKAAILAAEAEGEAGVHMGLDGASAKAKGSAGAYLAQASGEASGGFRIPFTNIMLGGSVSGQGSVGAGASGSASASFGEDGFHAGLAGSAALGLGGGLGLGFSVTKANKDAGWFG